MQTKTTGTPSVSPRFALGQVVATPAVLEHLERHGINASEYLNRHVRGDWGEVPPEDAACWRRFKIEPPCRLNFEPGLLANR